LLIAVDFKVRLQALVTLTKPRIALMVLVTVAVGYILGAAGGPIALGKLALTLVGTGLVAGGASAWNMILERDRDARMKRTASRPLPSGKLTMAEAVAFGSALALGGVAILYFGVNGLSSLVAAMTFVLYVVVYTPLKPLTSLNTAIGAIPGALPPVIGWAAASGRLGVEPWALFLIVFLWQFPHFLAIAWIYREDYARGGHKMLPNVDPDGSITGRQAMWHALQLVPAGLIPSLVGLGGKVYFVGALILGFFYFYYALKFWLDVNDRSARKLLRASILYLPLILLLLLLNPGR
jgi:protoheme IX farnesyltransferase